MNGSAASLVRSVSKSSALDLPKSKHPMHGIVLVGTCRITLLFFMSKASMHEQVPHRSASGTNEPLEFPLIFDPFLFPNRESGVSEGSDIPLSRFGYVNVLLPA